MIFKLLFTLAFSAPLNVVTTTTDLNWLVQRIGGDKVKTQALLQGTENPHFIDSRPDYIQKVSNADIVCAIGLELEIGWLPKILSKSGNAKVQPGGPGFCEAGNTVEVIEKPTGPIDRSMGDVHPSGNPHFWLSPKHFFMAAKEIKNVLSKNDSANSKVFEANYLKLQKEINDLLNKNLKRIKVIKIKKPYLEYHKEYSYFLDVYGLSSAGSLEEKPGLPPSASRLIETATSAKNANVVLMLAANYSPIRTLEKFQELSKIPFLALELSLNKENTDYLKYHEILFNKIIAPLEK
jgi:zinc/manganese transport system substrate-binding protein